MFEVFVLVGHNMIHIARLQKFYNRININIIFTNATCIAFDEPKLSLVLS